MQQKTTNGEFRYVSPHEREKEKAPRGRFIRDAAICAFLIAGIWAIAALDANVKNNISSREFGVSSSELINDEELGQLKFVGNDEVFPVDGEVVTTFSESGSKVELSAEPAAQVRAVLSGTVARVENGVVTISNDNGTRSIYTGMDSSVSEGEHVETAQVIGTLSDELLALETVSGIGYVDSLDRKELTETMD